MDAINQFQAQVSAPVIAVLSGYWPFVVVIIVCTVLAVLSGRRGGGLMADDFIGDVGETGDGDGGGDGGD